MSKAVGLSRAIKLEWLNKTVDLIQDGLSNNEIKDELNKYLSFEIKSPTNLRKTREILMNIWVHSENDNPEIRSLALSSFSDDPKDRMAIHWCMTLIAYPVFCDISGLIGKLLSMQDTFTIAWLKEKLYEMWGERPTLNYSIEKIIQTMKAVGGIESQKAGVYKTRRHTINKEAIIDVILLSILRIKNSAYLEIPGLSSVPQMFPLQYSISLDRLHNSPAFEINNFGGKITVSAKC